MGSARLTTACFCIWFFSFWMSDNSSAFLVNKHCQFLAAENTYKATGDAEQHINPTGQIRFALKQRERFKRKCRECCKSSAYARFPKQNRIRRHFAVIADDTHNKSYQHRAQYICYQRKHWKSRFYRYKAYRVSSYCAYCSAKSHKQKSHEKPPANLTLLLRLYHRRYEKATHRGLPFHNYSIYFTHISPFVFVTAMCVFAASVIS